MTTTKKHIKEWILIVDYRLSISDYRFLTLIWEHEPIRSAELVRICASELGWKKSTVYTMVKKLSIKGLIKNENAVIRSLVTKTEIQRQESSRFVEQVFSGSLPSFLKAYYWGTGISPAEAKELQDLIHTIKERD